MTNTATSEQPSTRLRSWPRSRLRLRRLAWLGVGLVVLLVVGYVAGPWMFWAYNIDRARNAMDGGLVWKEPREVDSLPAQRDANALDQALAHLAAAKRWRSGNAYAFRLAGQVYAAREQWVNAANELEQAQALQPNDRLLAWERALVYEQMAQVVAAAPSDNILAALVSGTIQTPDQPVDTVYCQNGQSQTCYVSLDTYTQPYAALPDGPDLTTDVLFMHPPASVSVTRTVDEEVSALSFLMGLDPGVRNWRSDGATFQVWLTTSDGSSNLVYEHRLDPNTAKRGWVPGAVDLSRWRGQQVTLELRTTGGPAGDVQDDWYAWGNVVLTTPSSANLALQAPKQRVMDQWQRLEYSHATMLTYADSSFERREYRQTVRWYKRALMLDPDLSTPRVFHMAVAAINAHDPQAGELLDRVQEHAAVNVVALNPGARFQATELSWITGPPGAPIYPGKPLSESMIGPYGSLYWSGGSVAVIDAREGGAYTLRVRAQHSVPAPVEVALGVDGQQLRTYRLSRGDDSWETLELPVALEPGPHTINVWFLNDGAVNGINRNAVFDWVELQPQP